MTALIREYNADPRPSIETEPVAALLGSCDLRCLVLMFLGAFRELAVLHAKLTAVVRGERGRDSVAFVDELLAARQAAARDEELQDDGG